MRIFFINFVSGLQFSDSSLLRQAVLHLILDVIEAESRSFAKIFSARNVEENEGIINTNFDYDSVEKVKNQCTEITGLDYDTIVLQGYLPNYSVKLFICLILH